MRRLAAVLLACCAGSVATAADMDEDKAKEVTVAFLKAWKAKDLDALMKTMDVPFVSFEKDGPKLFEKTDDLKSDLKAKLEKLKNTDPIPAEAGKLTDLPAIRKEFAKKPELLKAYEKVLGEKGYLVAVGTEETGDGEVLVRIKDGKAKVVGLPK